MTAVAKISKWKFVLTICGMALAVHCFSQDSTIHFARLTDTLNTKSNIKEDSALRIRNLNPYITLHVDSSLSYELEINKDPGHYFWYLKNSPVGLRINKDNGLLSFRAEKSYFLSGKLKYDYQYKVNVGVQNLIDPGERVDTSFTIVFFTTEIVPSHVKPTLSSTLFLDEGDTVNFRVECENGSFPIESISFFSNLPLRNAKIVQKCDDDFLWSPPFDFVKETDSAHMKSVILSFVGTNKFFVRDTAVVRIYVRDALNYPAALKEYNMVATNYSKYILQLKYAFVQLDQKVKKTKTTRSGFDLTTASTALGGTILSTSSATSTQNVGKVLPGVGVALVPVKETVAPPQTYEQNAASQVRGAIKRMQYTVSDNAVIGERDLDIVKKTGKLREELKQTQMQLIDVPIDETNNMSEEELNAYFNSPKVNKKYSLKKGK
ncbi:MAG: hypothetical protein ACHQET_01660 [Chitinophagales bacterium]